MRGSSRRPHEAGNTAMFRFLYRKFMSGLAILMPIGISLYIAFWLITFFDAFFSPLYLALFGWKAVGLGFVTSMAFITTVGIFMSSWAGELMLRFGEWCVQMVPFVKQVYYASKQISAAINPDVPGSRAFKECVIVRHPRKGELAFGFTTGETLLQTPEGEVQGTTVYVPTNHLYVGDVLIFKNEDILHPNLSVRQGIEIVMSCGITIPSTLLTSRIRNG